MLSPQPQRPDCYVVGSTLLWKVPSLVHGDRQREFSGPTLQHSGLWFAPGKTLQVTDCRAALGRPAGPLRAAENPPVLTGSPGRPREPQLALWTPHLTQRDPHVAPTPCLDTCKTTFSPVTSMALDHLTDRARRMFQNIQIKLRLARVNGVSAQDPPQAQVNLRSRITVQTPRADSGGEGRRREDLGAPQKTQPGFGFMVSD